MFKTHRSYDLETGVKNNSIAVLNRGKNVYVTYHKTLVVKKIGRTVTLDNGGWNTISTKMVQNRALELICSSVCNLYKVKGVMMLTQNGIVKPYVNGMKIKVRQ